jgi:hypothetical protein
LALLAIGGGLLAAFAAVSGRLRMSLPLEITADRGEAVVLGSVILLAVLVGALIPLLLQ